MFLLMMVLAVSCLSQSCKNIPLFSPFSTILFHLFLAVLGLCCYSGSSPVSASGGYPSWWYTHIYHCGFSCVGHGLSDAWASEVAVNGLKSTGSIVVAHWFSCSVAYGIFPDQGSNPCLLRRHTDSLPLSHQGSRPLCFLVEALQS